MCVQDHQDPEALTQLEEIYQPRQAFRLSIMLYSAWSKCLHDALEREESETAAVEHEVDSAVAPLLPLFICSSPRTPNLYFPATSAHRP